MNELTNAVTSVGNYNSIPTQLTSNTSVVNMIEGLSLTKEADRKNWGNGNLKYTITLDNQAEEAYTNVKITDEINTTLVNFIKGSVKINDIDATEDQASYNDTSHTLIVNLDQVAASSRTTVTFLVEKKAK